MRQISGDINRADRKPLRLARKAMATLTSVCLLAGLGFQSGCEVKSFIDPSEVGRYNNQPLLLPILKKLDTGFDEPDDEWANAVDPTASDLVFTAKDYRIGPGDLLNITISDLAGPGSETQRPIRVSDSGFVNVPLIDEIRAVELTETELQKAIRKAYRDGNLILDAQVSVSVVEARARTFSIRGTAVPRPGEYQILKKDFRLLDAIVIAGDVVSDAEYAYIIRQQTPTAVETPPSGGAAPAEAIPTAPATPSPGPDILAPRSDANPSIFTPGGSQGAWRIDLLRPRMMQTAADPNSGSAAPAAPATPEGRYITLDGKQVLVGAATQPTDASATQPVVVEALPLTPSTPTTPAAGSQPFAFQDLEPVAGERIIRVPIKQLLNGDTRFNIVVRPSDIITIPGPKTGFYYMGGHVARTGAFQLTGASVTLKQAIVSAGMLDQVAIPQRTDVIRRIGSDREVFARVNLDAIFAGKQSDIFIKPDDTIMVGTNFFAPFIAAIRNGFRFSYGFGFFYDRNFYDDPDNNNN